MFGIPPRLLVTAAILLAPAIAISYLVAEGDIRVAAYVFLPFTAMSLLSFLLSRRIASRWAPPPAKPLGPTYIEPSTDRPEHVQRRRERRRPRR